MSERKESDYLEDIREALVRILEYTDGMVYESFIKDHKSQDAVVRNFEIIGEAVKNISDQYKNDHPEIPWKSMAGMRDKLIHHYFGVNFDVVWGVIKNDLRKVLNEIQALL